MAIFVAFANSWLMALQAWKRLSVLVPSGAVLYGALIFFARDLLDLLLQTLRKGTLDWY
jgi:hypothetical protein